MQASTSGISSPHGSVEEKPVFNEAAAASVDQFSKEGDDSDSDVRKVPEMVGRASSSGAASGKHQGARKRNALPAEKEHKRMKRLLRNRVSAQQARERKKAYVSDLEARTKELEQRNAELEEKLSTLQQENAMLRKIIKSTAIRSQPEQ
ncbi:hypothetical protein KP509_13G093700 [Ceratopteris richardii]|uniref:BZIP domain-containing protein n=1 Tax=Ceratopteris richardii TaxID=49495 RepID=A0A8T2TL98_CERRI|nr:hypothetical protein KP509_13G093700 [Ceratopteris richardii]